jgi:hypothetical protein
MPEVASKKASRAGGFFLRRRPGAVPAFYGKRIDY